MTSAPAKENPLLDHANSLGDTRKLTEKETDNIVISSMYINEHQVVLSRYGDSEWRLQGLPTNTPTGESVINFQLIPPSLVESFKAIIFRYMRRGRDMGKIPKPRSVIKLYKDSLPFVSLMELQSIKHFSEVSGELYELYVNNCRDMPKKNGSKPLSNGTLQNRFVAVEAIYELSQFTLTPIPVPPWPDSSATLLSGRSLEHRLATTTPLMPDKEFCDLFSSAEAFLKKSHSLLALNEGLIEISRKYRLDKKYSLVERRIKYLSDNGWTDTLSNFNMEYQRIRTSCYIIIASTSGCRNHELDNLQNSSHRKSYDTDGTIYHWMTALSEKTDAGLISWMIPSIAVKALRTMERWAAPRQAELRKEIDTLLETNPNDPHIQELKKHSRALFLTSRGPVRTLSIHQWNVVLKTFCEEHHIHWNIATHHFRRKFANYAAHSNFGDLRYLRDHYAHCAIDMTLGYAMDEKWGKYLDLELFNEIDVETNALKTETVNVWLNSEELAGGYGKALKHWQRNPDNLTMYSSQAEMVKIIASSTSIRSNGHGWCTADDNECIGNTIEPSRCGNNCCHSVIGPEHSSVYQHLHRDLKSLLDCKDIGINGQERVARDLKRYEKTLNDLNSPIQVTSA